MSSATAESEHSLTSQFFLSLYPLHVAVLVLAYTQAEGMPGPLRVYPRTRRDTGVYATIKET